ncbi:hypothetical protein FA15DRAFT_673355 [Coprinopsis marcescibilis]|uniref:SWI/SNF and RSC complexes subunit Ssr4 N-terminal domain-containing protein n=1 Tax=Coprinopsis marcescibilis TaxID=230819 RepID=A0A5C3KKY4_COPMA|nr:hypothetical protein FA15DRAFT_673355 [Coprinopsis marcescibilis]
MALSLTQAQAEGFSLHFPENLGQAPNVTVETAVNMLQRATSSAQNVPFRWQYIDKPHEGQLALLFLPQNLPFPNDGIRWQEAESTMTMNVAPGRELEVTEARSGFIPGSQDQNAWRLRRRYRLLRGGHSALVLVHYTRGQPAPIIPALMNQPVRSYPLRTVPEPPRFVIGEKAGTKIYPPQQSNMPHPQSTGFVSHPAQAILNQNHAMEQLERKREQQREKERSAARERSGSTGGRPNVDDGSDDETDQIATRTLALARYKRNHELMSDVFRQAAFGDKSITPKSPYSIFDKETLEGQTARLQADIERLQRKGEERRAARANRGNVDVSMEQQTSA